MRELLRMLRPARQHWRWMAGGIGLGVAVIAANAALMAISGWFIASMAVAGVTQASFNYFFASASIRALAILRASGRYGERLVSHEAAFHILADLRVWLFKRLIPLAPAGLESYAGGDLAGRLRADVDSLENLYLRIIAPLATGAFTILLSGLFVLVWSGSAALLLVGLLLLSGLLLPLLARHLAEQPGKRSTELAGMLRTTVTEGLQGAEELLLLGATDKQAQTVEGFSSGLVQQQVRLGQISSLTLAGVTICGALAMAGLALVCIPLVQTGQLAGPNLVMLLLFSAASFEAVGPLAHSLQLIPATSEAIRRIRELADAPIPLPEPLHPQLPESCRIVLDQVSCGYGGGQAVLEQFSLTINQGERVAVVGPSGSGKSTLVELLLRFRPYQGSISIGGCELLDISPDQLAQLVAAVPQQPHLFNSTIRENILLGREVTDEQLTAVLVDSGLEQWITGLPQGLDTPVGETGSAVSGGEARRIALARALVSNAPILLLDEPTEGLDGATEQSVVERLKLRLQGTTLLVVTHRPACLQLAERIVRIGATKGANV
ncbi:MAG: thiol reductant ABC exporter subunit CydC [Geobacteraceae bacterium]|nr:thiol reductant ABC exporter subunit CydC [Geobacteraceae bacterium]